MSSTLSELARRTNNGIEVTLLWNRRSGDLKVRVSDSGTGCEFELAAGRENALDVFHHPYAHAASRGIDYDDGSRPSIYTEPSRIAA